MGLQGFDHDRVHVTGVSNKYTPSADLGSIQGRCRFHRHFGFIVTAPPADNIYCSHGQFISNCAPTAGSHMSYLFNIICFYTQGPRRKRGNTESLVDTAGQTLGVLHVAYDPSCCQSLMNQARNTSKDVLHGPHVCVTNLPPASMVHSQCCHGNYLHDCHRRLRLPWTCFLNC